MRAWRDLARLPRPLWVQFFATLVNRLGTMALPFLVLYLTRSLGYSASAAGLVLGGYGLGAFVMGPLGGWLCDRLGAGRVMTASLASSGLILFAYPFARGPWAVAAATLAWAMTAEVFRPASLADTSALAAPEQRKSAFALNRLAINLGMSLGPAIGGFLAARSFAALFYANGAASLAAAAILAGRGGPGRRARGGAALSAPEPPGAEPAVALEPAPASRESPWASLRSACADRRLMGMLLAFFPVSLVFFQHDGAVPLFLVRDLGLPESAYGALFTINTVLIILLEIPLNSAMDRWPNRRAMALGAALFGLGFGAMLWARSFWSTAATVVVWTFGEMILFPAAAAYVADVAPAARRGGYMGLYTASFSAAFTLAPWGGIQVMEAWGTPVLWLLCLALGLLSALGLARAR